MKMYTQEEIDKYDIRLTPAEQGELVEMWERQLEMDNLKSIEHTSENGVTYVHGQRPGGKRMYPLDTLDGYNAELRVNDQYFTSKDTPQQFEQVLTQEMVNLLPKPIKRLGEKKRDHPNIWNRKDGQQLRRYTQYLTYDKLESKARQAITG